MMAVDGYDDSGSSSFTEEEPLLKAGSEGKVRKLASFMGRIRRKYKVKGSSRRTSDRSWYPRIWTRIRRWRVGCCRRLRCSFFAHRLRLRARASHWIPHLRRGNRSDESLLGWLLSHIHSPFSNAKLQSSLLHLISAGIFHNRNSVPEQTFCRHRKLQRSWAARPKRVPRGFVAVYVGQEHQRFVIPVPYLHHPLFEGFLKAAEEEFGYHQNGGLFIPCEVPDFEETTLRMKDSQILRRS